jgi:diguanylate cyclase (GGDEF)-like protein
LSPVKSIATVSRDQRPGALSIGKSEQRCRNRKVRTPRAATRPPRRGGFVIESTQTIAPAMTPDRPPVTPLADPEAQALQRRRAWALAAACSAGVGLGALLGHGLGQSVSRTLPPDWAAATPALVGAAVAALLVPLAGWAAIRIVAPTLPRQPKARKAPASVTPLRSAPPAAAAEVGGSADAQAPARDALTGAYTQQHFVAATDREWSRIRRHGEDAAVLMVDVDHFRRLNDEHGSAAGDAMLVEITRLASSTLRPYDLLARFGGGVLVVYLPHTDPLGALDVAERIRERVAGLRLAWQGQSVRATISVGVAGIGLAHGGLDAVIADAGAALREAKGAGRNCVRAAPIPPRQSHSPARSAG